MDTYTRHLLDKWIKYYTKQDTSGLGHYKSYIYRCATNIPIKVISDELNRVLVTLIRMNTSSREFGTIEEDTLNHYHHFLKSVAELRLKLIKETTDEKQNNSYRF